MEHKLSWVDALQGVLTREDDGEEEKMMNCLSMQREGKLWTYI
jgi:hypothetical protein